VIVVGGVIDRAASSAAAAGLQPRADVIELQSRLGAELVDLATLAGASGRFGMRRVLGWLGRRTGLWSLWLAVYTAIRARDADTVYAISEDVGFPLALLLRVTHARRPRLVVRLEDPLRGRSTWRYLLNQAITRLALRRTDRALCLTSAHLQYLHSVLGVPLDRLTLARHHVDTRFFDPGSHPSKDDQVGGLPEGPFVFSAGLELRDYATLVAAAEGLDLPFVVAAASPWSHSGLDREALPALPPNVVFRTFPIGKLREVYRRAAVVAVPLHPTLRCSGANVILESWAMARPVVATRTAGQLDYAEHGRNVLFVEPHEPEALRGAITRLIDDPSEAERLGRRGREDAERTFGLDAHLELVARALGAPARGDAAARQDEQGAAEPLDGRPAVEQAPTAHAEDPHVPTRLEEAEVP
jgi:glycosyltransferase involved in cell wall biosynthesis